MQIFLKISAYICLLVILSCSASYKKLSNNKVTPKNEFSKYLLEEYKQKADFEAIEMHDWNSAKLYSEKALAAIEGEEILPEKITYWTIETVKRFDLIKSYNNLMTVYSDALKLDPYNLAKAISSLDCWSEQQEEKWQIWDINKCRDDYLNAMHAIYDVLDKKEKKLSKLESNSKNLNNVTSIVTQDVDKNILQIIYFDFDKSKLSGINIIEIKNFINKNGKKIKKYIVVGHTDTMGTKKYNINLSLKRADAVKKALINLGIKKENIKILGKGEEELSVKTGDEVEHPANRRAEISPLN